MNRRTSLLVLALLAPPAMAGGRFGIATSAGNEIGFDVVFGGGQYLVAIQGGASDPHQITAQRISTSGSLIGPRIDTGAIGFDPLVSFDGTNYLLVWQDCDENATCTDELRAQFISTSGALGADISLGTGPVDDISGLAYGQGSYLVTYRREANEPTSDTDLFGKIVSASGVAGQEFTISTGFADHHFDNVAFGGGNFLVVWVDDLNDADVMGRYVSPSGVLGLEFLINGSPAISDFGETTVHHDGSQFIVAFTDQATTVPVETSDLLFQRVGGSGNLIGGVIQVDGPGIQVLPSITSADGEILVTWTDATNDANFNLICEAGEGTCIDVRGRFFTSSGSTLGGSFPISIDPGIQLFSPTTTDGSRFLTVFTEGGIEGGDVFGIFAGEGGGPIPLPRDDTFHMFEGDTLTGNVTVNDDLAAGLGTVNIDMDNPIDNGDLTLNSDGTFLYTPFGAGTDSFGYQITDSNGTESQEDATVTINVEVDRTRATIVTIDSAADLDSQIDNAIAMANGASTTVRIRFPAGTYSYAGGANNGTYATPISGSVTFEAVSPGSGVQVQGQGGGRWFVVDGGTVEVLDLTARGFAPPSGSGGMASVRSGGKLTVRNATLDNNAATGAGGALEGQKNARITIRNSVLRGNTSGGAGGGVWVDSGSTLRVSGTTFESNQATGDGGGVHILDSGPACSSNVCPLDVEVLDSSFTANTAGRAGAISIDIADGTSRDALLINNVTFDSNTGSAGACDVRVSDQRSPATTGRIVVRDSTFSGDCANARVSNPGGGMTLNDSTLVHDGNALSSGGAIDLGGSVLVDESLVTGRKGAGSPACTLLPGGLIKSLGFNISSDDSCNLDQPTDLPETDPMVSPVPGRPGKFDLLPTSPAVDAALAILTDLVGSGDGKSLPCGYKDLNGLGRPQDGNGDGTFECDIGHVEVQGGDDIVPPQSSAYFDPDRGGEGVFMELIGGDLAFVAMFTYPPAGDGMAWFVGIGNVVGNSVVVDDMLVTTGGVFGEAFDPTRILRTSAGSMSFNFPTCESTDRPGRLAFQAALDSGFQDLLAASLRLSTILNCSGGAAPTAGRSGSFFDPARDGEGIFVQWLTDGRVVVIWYTYDTEGNQFWTISGDVQVDGNRVVASMLYPAQTTNFGEAFQAADIVLEDWGTLTLDYTDCNSVQLDYDSEIEGFGTGSYSYVRLTSLSGTDCDL